MNPGLRERGERTMAQMPYRFEYVWGAFLLRFVLGMLSLVAGLDKFFGGMGDFRQKTGEMFAKTWLPPFLYDQFLYALPWAEVILGALIVLALFRLFSLVLGSLLMLSLAFG